MSFADLSPFLYTAAPPFAFSAPSRHSIAASERREQDEADLLSYAQSHASGASAPAAPAAAVRPRMDRLASLIVRGRGGDGAETLPERLARCEPRLRGQLGGHQAESGAC